MAYQEQYREYIIKVDNDTLNIYDKYGNYVTKLETNSIRSAKIKIDEIIKNSRR